jgi:outer membrane lipoprotein-sorting protein
MNRNTPTRRCLVALPLVAMLLAACARTSPVDEIVAANLAARGGEAKIRALRSIRETGTVTASGGRVARIVRERKRPGLFRLEFTYQGTTSVFAHDGATGWQIAPLQGQFEPQAMAPEADSAGGVDQRDIEGPLVDWRAKGHLVELVGREKLPGGEADKLKVTLKGGAVRYDYVDVTSHQVVRSAAPRTVRGHGVMLENDFSDFRKVGGLTFPFHVETRIEGRPEVLTVSVDKIELDPALDDSLFVYPK